MRNALSPQRGDMFIEKVLLPTLSPHRGDMLIASLFIYCTQDIYRNNTDRGKIIFSEIMYASNGYTDPQWIELYNTSKTEVVNLEGWRLQVEAPEEKRTIRFW